MSLTSYRAAPPRVKEDDIQFVTHVHDARAVIKRVFAVLCRPGDDLLSQVLRHSTIGAGAFDGRVRDGIGSDHLAKATRPAKDRLDFEVNVELVF